MTDIVAEFLRAGLTAAIFLFTLTAGRRLGLSTDPGWRLITSGFGVLVFATLWDASDNFDALSAYGIVGNTPAQAVLEKIVGYLGGFALLFAGFLRWLPLAGETKAARRELAALNRDLERRVAERTAELEQASRAKSDFLARMSHELRTPLNAVIGLSELMAKQASGPRGTERCVEYAGHINASGRHLLGMVEEILDLSRIEAGRMELEETRIDLAVISREAITMLDHAAAEGEVALEVRREGELPPVLADGQRLRQILVNLISNAIKFTPSGGRVVLALGTDDDGAPRIEVQDTGIGMTAEDLDRVRQPFVQGRQLEERKSAGTGLGLVLVEQLVELHGGEFRLSSTPGKGTTATVLLPVARVFTAESLDDSTRAA